MPVGLFCPTRFGAYPGFRSSSPCILPHCSDHCFQYKADIRRKACWSNPDILPNHICSTVTIILYIWSYSQNHHLHTTLLPLHYSLMGYPDSIPKSFLLSHPSLQLLPHFPEAASRHWYFQDIKPQKQSTVSDNKVPSPVQNKGLPRLSEPYLPPARPFLRFLSHSFRWSR